MPNNKVLLITADYYKRNSVVNLNVDTELIHPQIIKAQNLNIERALGTNLFNVLMAEVSAGFNYKVTNKAVVKKSSDNSEASNLNEVNYLRQDVRDDAEYYTDRLVKFLCANEVTYPEYINGNINDDDIVPSKKSFFGSIYLS